MVAVTENPQPSTSGSVNAAPRYVEYRPTWRDRLTFALLGRNELGPPDGDGYTVRVAEGHRFLDWRHITDPFIVTHVKPSGWRAALAVLLGLYEIEVRVSADGQTIERVLELNPDYLGRQGSERRNAWNAHLNKALGDFADEVPE